jgi:Ala-tRNA(Pro) deacylase
MANQKRQKVFDFFKKHQIDYELHEHPAVFTCEEAEKYINHLPGIHSKNLVLIDKKKDRIFMITLEAEKRLDLKWFRKLVQAPKLSFANEEILNKYLGLSGGSVSPFGLINDKNQKIIYYLDQDVYDAQEVNFHPNDNTASLVLDKKMFHQFLKGITHKISLLKIT